MDNIEIQNKDGNEITISLPGIQPQTASNYGIFYISNRTIEIVRVKEVHNIQGTDAGAVTLQIEKLVGDDTVPAQLGMGKDILKTTINLKGAKNTPVTFEGTTLTSDRILLEGDRLALKLSGTPTAIEGLCVTIYFKYTNGGHYKLK